MTIPLRNGEVLPLTVPLEKKKKEVTLYRPVIAGIVAALLLLFAIIIIVFIVIPWSSSDAEKITPPLEREVKNLSASTTEEPLTDASNEAVSPSTMQVIVTQTTSPSASISTGSFASVEYECPPLWSLLPSTRSCYRMLPGLLTFDQADHACKNHDSVLVSIHSLEEANFVDIIGAHWYYWIGLRVTHDRVFEWIDGTPLDFEYWAPGEPNNAFETRPENCGLRANFWGHEGKWNDERCRIFHRPMCKRGASNTT